MTHQLPQLLPHCSYSHFCKSCRDREGGRVFRKGVLERQGVECDVDFDCPKKKPWSKRYHNIIPAPGDTAHYLANATLIGPTFKRILKWTGSTCKCEKRRKEWNEIGWRGLLKALFKR